MSIDYSQEVEPFIIALAKIVFNLWFFNELLRPIGRPGLNILYIIGFGDGVFLV